MYIWPPHATLAVRGNSKPHLEIEIVLLVSKACCECCKERETRSPREPRAAEGTHRQAWVVCKRSVSQEMFLAPRPAKS